MGGERECGAPGRPAGAACLERAAVQVPVSHVAQAPARGRRLCKAGGSKRGVDRASDETNAMNGCAGAFEGDGTGRVWKAMAGSMVAADSFADILEGHHEARLKESRGHARGPRT